jgi:hypothetical protein
MILACELNNFFLMNRLLNYGPDLGLMDEKSFTPLMILSKHGNSEMIRIFIALLDINHPSGRVRQTTLQTFKSINPALEEKDLQLAYINYKTKDNYSALSLAHQNKHEDLATLLSQRGANSQAGRKWMNAFTRNKKRNCKGTRKVRRNAAAVAATAGAAPTDAADAAAVAAAGTGADPTAAGTGAADAGAADAGAAGTGADAGAAGTGAAAADPTAAGTGAAGTGAPTAAAAPPPTTAPTAAPPGTPPPAALVPTSHATALVTVSGQRPSPPVRPLTLRTPTTVSPP